MPRLACSTALLGSLACSACIEDVFIDTGDSGTLDQFPQRDDWRLAIDAELAPEVAAIFLGGAPFEQNFANRGDIEVRFDGAEGRIRVELRRFAFAEDPEAASATYDKLWAWAYTGETLRHPAPDMAPNDCSETWRDACELRVYYDGQIQPEASGADLRVTLPSTWRGQLGVITEDLIADDYPMRGDVRLDGLRGSADVSVQRGTVDVRLAPDVLVAPACGPEANESCAQFSEDGEPAPWAVACGCTDFGHLRVEGWASDVTIDLPPGLWSSVSLENAQFDGPEPHCEVDLGCEAFDACEVEVDTDEPGAKRAETNDPGPSALEGAGYAVRVSSDACGDVDYVDGPDDYGAPALARRGDLRVCSGCFE